jgi:hypothetical protein
MFPKFETITPWALVEPREPAAIDPRERKQLFGDASLGLLYSGSFGRAHSAHLIPRLAEQLSAFDGRIAFSVRAQDAAKLKRQMGTDGASIAFAPFAASGKLESRLSAADVHIVSLRESWTGTVVPSKFFGALAIGRPVLFLGSQDSALAMWIKEFRVGWILNDNGFDEVVRELAGLSFAKDAKLRLFYHCHNVYKENFSRSGALDRWDLVLRELISS